MISGVTFQAICAMTYNSLLPALGIRSLCLMEPEGRGTRAPWSGCNWCAIQVVWINEDLTWLDTIIHKHKIITNPRENLSHNVLPNFKQPSWGCEHNIRNSRWLL